MVGVPLDVEVGVSVGVPLGVEVGVPVGVPLGVEVGVPVDVALGVDVAEQLAEDEALNEAEALLVFVPDALIEADADVDDEAVGVQDDVPVGVLVGVEDGVPVGVLVGVEDGVVVGVLVGVEDGVAVGVLVAVGKVGIGGSGTNDVYPISTMGTSMFAT